MPPVDPPFPTPKIVESGVLLTHLLSKACTFQVAVMGRAVLRRGWTMGPRVVAGHLIYALESGHVVGNVGGGAHEIRPAGAIWVQPGVKHAFSLGAGCDEASILYSRFFVGRGETPHRLAPDALFSEPEPQVCEIFSALIGPGLSETPLETLRQRTLLAASMCHILAGSVRPMHRSGLRADQRERAVRFVQDHLADRMTIEDIARHVGLNAAYFTQQFKLSFGVTPRAYVTSARVRAAAALLAGSNLSVKQAAAQLGYDDIYFFSKQFKQVMHMSPRRWRSEAMRGTV